MVWQDFMFGNDWQPGTYAFKLNIEAEAEDQVRRLRNHPSIVLWCGNNETESAFDWGQRATALPPDVQVPDVAGLPHRVQRHPAARGGAAGRRRRPTGPARPAPTMKRLSDDYQTGDKHDWSVWHGRVPFTDYEKHSLALRHRVRLPVVPGDAHRRGLHAARGSHRHLHAGDAGPPEEQRRQLHHPRLHAQGLSRAARISPASSTSARCCRPRASRSAPSTSAAAGRETMGSIFWQLNDCWPVASWSSIDYYGRWKALQYYARRFYAPVLVSPHVEDGVLKVYIVSDKAKAEQEPRCACG